MYCTLLSIQFVHVHNSQRGHMQEVGPDQAAWWLAPSPGVLLGRGDAPLISSSLWSSSLSWWEGKDTRTTQLENNITQEVRDKAIIGF